MKMLKIPLKVMAMLLIVVIVLLLIVMKILIHLSSYVVGLFMLFLIACGIYTIVQGLWNQLLILSVLLFLCVLVLFAATWIVVALENAHDGLQGFVRG